jgi:ABC transport system ATP-binding/permease protein
VANLDICDRLLVLVPGGKVAFYGPPAEGLKYFRKPGWAEVFQAFDNEPDRDWAADFRASPYYAEYVAGGLSGPAPVAARDRAAPPPPPRSRGRLGQLSTLSRRYLAVIASDRGYLGILSILPIALGLLVRATPAPLGLAGPAGRNTDAQALLLILVIAACFIGGANSVRELVKERAIYTRERAAGLSAGAYLWSKLIVLGVISLVQAVVLVAIGLAGRPMPMHGVVLKSSPLAELLIAIGVLALASMALGLLVSASVSTAEKTMPLLVLLSLAQVVLSGGVVALNGKAGLNQLSYFAPSRWGFAATASTTRLSRIDALPPDPLWRHTPAQWFMDVGLEAVLGVLFALITWRMIIRLSPGRKRR